MDVFYNLCTFCSTIKCNNYNKTNQKEITVHIKKPGLYFSFHDWHHYYSDFHEYDFICSCPDAFKKMEIQINKAERINNLT